MGILKNIFTRYKIALSRRLLLPVFLETNHLKDEYWIKKFKSRYSYLYGFAELQIADQIYLVESTLSDRKRKYIVSNDAKAELVFFVNFIILTMIRDLKVVSDDEIYIVEMEFGMYWTLYHYTQTSSRDKWLDIYGDRESLFNEIIKNREEVSCQRLSSIISTCPMNPSSKTVNLTVSLEALCYQQVIENLLEGRVLWRTAIKDFF